MTNPVTGPLDRASITSSSDVRSDAATGFVLPRCAGTSSSPIIHVSRVWESSSIEGPSTSSSPPAPRPQSFSAARDLTQENRDRPNTPSSDRKTARRSDVCHPVRPLDDKSGSVLSEPSADLDPCKLRRWRPPAISLSASLAHKGQLGRDSRRPRR
jgi:hypothetical protein